MPTYDELIIFTISRMLRAVAADVVIILNVCC